MSNVVLDSSAILAVIQNEPGQENVRPFLNGALVSTVNLAEVTTHLARSGAPQFIIEKAISKLSIHPYSFPNELVSLTGMLVQKTRQYGLSLGDRACLALGITKGFPVITADTIWADIDLPVEVRLIR